MSTVGTITKLATDVAGKAAHAVTHPVATATTVAGTAKKVAATVVGTATDKVDLPGRTGKSDRPERSARSEQSDRPEPTVVVTPDPKAAADAAVEAERARAAETESQEPSTTEPKAASREGAHHGRGEEPTDDWHDEIQDGPDVGTNPATGQPHSQLTDDEPLIDPSVAKAVRAESETLSKAADPDKEQ